MLTTPNLDPTSLLPAFGGSLSVTLRLSGERDLLEFHSLTRDTYSTERFLSGDSTKHDDPKDTIPVGGGFFLCLEPISLELIRYCAQHDLSLARNADAHLSVGLIRAAVYEMIKPFPFLWNAVSELVWRCHLVLAQDKDYDISFSDPAIPFSIFVSAPTWSNRRSILRIAENLVHEAMHLQLTLFESSCPLIDKASCWSMYSPWKQQERPAQGILHGLYVFCVLRWMWQQIVLTTKNEEDRDFSHRRIIEINEEVLSVRPFENCPALTKSGRLLIDKIFESL
jgi:hypothetical protein